jgi:hypothetical protein
VLDDPSHLQEHVGCALRAGAAPAVVVDHAAHRGRGSVDRQAKVTRKSSTR